MFWLTRVNYGSASSSLMILQLTSTISVVLNLSIELRVFLLELESRFLELWVLGL